MNFYYELLNFATNFRSSEHISVFSLKCLELRKFVAKCTVKIDNKLFININFEMFLALGGFILDI